MPRQHSHRCPGELCSRSASDPAPFRLRDILKDHHPAAPGCANVSGTLVSIIIGYDAVTLREKVDLRAAGDRLNELGELRSLSALNEKVALFRFLGRLDGFVTSRAEDGVCELKFDNREDEAAFQAHWNGPSLARARQEAGDMLQKVSGTRFTPVE